MSILKKSSFSALLAATLVSGIFTANANATQFVADLVPKEWVEINRSVDVRQKLYSANLYGASAEVQIMFKNSGTPTIFNVDQLAVNSTIFTCRGTQVGDVLGTLDPTTTQVCSFAPQLLLTNGANLGEQWGEYWMRIKLKNATDRSVTLRHLQPVSPQCSNSGGPAYNPLTSCEVVTHDLSFNNNQIFKPRVLFAGEAWAPLAIKNNKYRVRLQVVSNGTPSNSKVELVNGLKLKVSGSIPAEPNEELLDGAEFTTSCIMEKGGTLAVGVHECEFVAADDGFMHIPLKRIGTTGQRRVITTITNITP